MRCQVNGAAVISRIKFAGFDLEEHLVTFTCQGRWTTMKCNQVNISDEYSFIDRLTVIDRAPLTGN